MKKSIACLLILCMLGALLAGCGSAPAASAEAPKAEDPAPAEESKTEEAAPAEAEPEEEDEENYETGDASLDDPLNQDGIGEKELLVVSFGTSFNDSRRLTIGAIEKWLQTGFPDWSVRRAFTSQIIIDHVKNRDGEVIDNVGEALDRAVANGVKILVVQPTHLMDGFEYTDLKNELAEYADAFDQIVLSKPLLVSDDDFTDVADAIVDATAGYDDGKTAICFMGHGTEAESNGVYAKMQTVLTEMGMDNYYVGTVEAEPSVDDVLAQVQSGDYSRVVLRPLMIVAGDHANNDMAGDEDDSWKSIFEGAGYEVECVVEGLGQLEAIQELILAHAADAILNQVK
ncbi:MAG: sirohydrochlorin cobaltochelatase [Oscillospiraceae bacterium]|nr:sirohydrochlorin cobaltochelatase [Oscillospiraceae bacterium]